MAGDKFWSDASLQPKRNHRFLLQLGGGTGDAAGSDTKIQKYIVKTSGRPSYTVNDVQHNYLNHEFNFPGNVSWEELTISFVDPIENGSTQKVVQMIQESGYNLPSEGPEATQTVGKRRAVEALGKCIIKQLNAEGNVIEKFYLNNAWISQVEWSDFDYEDDDISDITITVKYDWARTEEIDQPTGNPQNGG